MTDYLFNTPNLTGGIDNMLVDVAEEVSMFIPMMLVFIWFVVFLSGSSAQKRRTGSADFPMWATMSSMSTLLISLAMTLIGGLINLFTLVIVVCITVICGAWLFLDKRNTEI